MVISYSGKEMNKASFKSFEDLECWRASDGKGVLNRQNRAVSETMTQLNDSLHYR